GDTVAWAVTQYRSGRIRHGYIEQIPEKGGVIIRYNTDCTTGRTTARYGRELIKVLDPLNGQVTITKSRLNSLEEDADLLSALQAHGVDNWNGYSEALEEVGLG
ncbi:hypothetical protein LCGC14_2843490, partial [marine sediment metagenome]